MAPLRYFRFAKNCPSSTSSWRGQEETKIQILSLSIPTAHLRLLRCAKNKNFVDVYKNFDLINFLEK